MAKRTSRYVMLPWLKGLDTDTDEGILQFMGGRGDNKAGNLTQGDDIIFSVDGSKIKRDGFQYHDNAAITLTPTLIGGFDYWANVSSVKSQRIVCLDNQATGKVWYQPGAGGAWTELTKHTDAVAPTVLTRVCFEVFNDDLVMALTDNNTAGRAPLKWNNQTGTVYEALGGFPPNVKYIRKHQGRLWAAGDPARPDRIYFTTPGNHEEWNGVGDSGAMDIDPGDGDSSGITAILPTFKGALFVCKANAIYKITGDEPNTYRIDLVTSGVGCISHNSAISIDLDDIYFASERGIHSLVATEKYGDFEGAFLSNTIQREYNSLDVLHKPFIQGVWIPSLNSAIWSVSRNGTRMDQMWGLDIRFRAWFKWTGVNPTTLFRVEDSITKIKRAYFGNNAGRLSKTQNVGIYHDYTNTPIDQVMQTPFIYPDNDPATIKGFKKLGVWLKMPAGTILTATIRLAGVNSTQTLEFESTASGTAKLGVDFILGVSELNADGVLRMTPYTLPIDGYGSSMQITFNQAELDEYCALFGFWIEWEPAGDSQETIGF